MTVTRVTINGRKVIEGINADVATALKKFGGRVRAIARASMVAQTVVGTKLVLGNPWIIYAQTPLGDPPRTRLGFIKHYINAAMDTDDDGSIGVVVGPEAIDRLSVDCLARLEYGDHPYMHPAYDEVIDDLPQIWADAVGSST